MMIVFRENVYLFEKSLNSFKDIIIKTTENMDKKN